MIKPPLLHDETLRLQSLQSLKILDTEPEERFDRITRLAQLIFNVPIALVSLVDTDRQWFKSRQGIDAAQTPRDVSFCGHAIVERKVFVITNAADDRRFCDNPLVLEDPHIRFYAGFPLTSGSGERVGTLCIIDREPREFTVTDAEKLRLLGELAEQELFALRQATTDELTGLVNRRGFQMTGHHVIDICRRLEQPVSLALFDLDNLKQINDKLGHNQGDLAIETFSSCLLKAYRESDVVARLGGDEFGVLFAGVAPDDMDQIVARLTQKIAQKDILADSDMKIDFSYGIASHEGNNPTSLEAMLSDADLQMYARKRAKKQQRA